MDDVLDAGDAREISTKIEESEFASNIVRRIGSATGNQLLGAPKYDGRGMAQDPNSVAEYLDGLMPADRVPAFEKVCLESDIHLSEVAACHQILTLVLGKPADTPPSLRDKIYRVGHAVPAAEPAADSVAQQSSPPVLAAADDSSAAADDSSAAAPTMPPAPAPLNGVTGKSKEEPSHAPPLPAEPPTRAKPEVPDYLKETSRPKIWPYLATLGLVFLFTLVALRAMGKFDSTHPLAQMMSGNQEVAQADPDAESDPTAKTGKSKKQSGQKNNTNESDKSNNDTKTTKPRNEGPKGDLKNPEPRVPDEGTGPVAPLPPVDPTRTNPPQIDPTGEFPEIAPPTPLVTGDPTPPVDPLAGSPTPVTPPSTDPGTVDPGTTDPGTGDPVTKPPLIPLPGDPEPLAPKVPIAKRIAILESPEHLLAGRKDVDSDWVAIPDNAEITTQTDLLVLSGFRPHLKTESGLELDVLGETRFKFDTDAGGNPVVVCDYGRMVVRNPSVGPLSIGMKLFEREGMATLAGSGSELVIHVARIRESGIDPMKGPIHIVARLQCLKGEVQWDGSIDRATLGPGRFAMLINGAPAIVDEGAEAPAWTNPRNDDALERMARRELMQRIDPAKSLALALLESTDFRRKEVASLAIVGLCAIDYYDPFIDAIDDVSFRSYWKLQFDAIQTSLARNQASVEELQKTLLAERPSGARDLYMLLVGFSPAQLEEGAATKLVDLLSNDSMGVRVLTNENLRRITGLTLGYRPEANAASNRSAVQRWKAKLVKREIRYPEEEAPEEPAEEVKPPEPKEPGITPVEPVRPPGEPPTPPLPPRG